MIFHLQTVEQASAIMAKIWPNVKDTLKAGKALRMEIKADTRSDEQNAKYHAMNQTSPGWRKRQIALEKMAENARELGLDYKPEKTSMTKDLKALIEDLRLNHEYCPKDVILQAADELEKALKELRAQDALLESQTARIVDLQEHIDNFDGEDR